jgi:hypothetical protein
MLVCRSAGLETWNPDFSSSEQADPTWTRVVVPRGEVTNALGWIDWEGNPVQVILCEACGCAGCATGGYVHVSRLCDWLLWTTPQPAKHGPDDLPGEREHPLVRRHGGLVVPGEEWERWRHQVTDLPAMEQFPSANGQVLADAWRMSVVGPGRASSLSEVVPTLRKHLVHSDSLGVDGAIEAVEGAVARLDARADEELRGGLVSPESLAVRIETLYFDGPNATAWPALALGEGEPLLVLAPDLVFVPEQ